MTVSHCEDGFLCGRFDEHVVVSTPSVEFFGDFVVSSLPSFSPFGLSPGDLVASPAAAAAVVFPATFAVVDSAWQLTTM